MFYDLFCDLCKQKNVSPTRASLEIGLSKSTATKWKNTGATPNGETLSKIAEYFGVSTDYLLNGDTSKNSSITSENEKSPSPVKEEEQSIEEILSRTRKQLESQEGLMFDGGVAPQEAIDSIIAAMEIGLQLAKERTQEEKERTKKLKADIIREAERLEEENRRNGK